MPLDRKELSKFMNRKKKKKGKRWHKSDGYSKDAVKMAMKKI